KGYLSQELADDLAKTGITFITKKRRNMKAHMQAEWDKIMLSRRFIIETINGQLKIISQIEHSRHRSIKGFLLTVLGGVI
ncbi:transposase, partial [Xenorhabdus sp. XENO-10]